jgi:hypothetical protein
MNSIRTLLSRFAALFYRQKLNDDLDEELRTLGTAHITALINAGNKVSTIKLYVDNHRAVFVALATGGPHRFALGRLRRAGHRSSETPGGSRGSKECATLPRTLSNAGRFAPFSLHLLKA